MIEETLIVKIVFTIIAAIVIHFYFLQNRIKTYTDAHDDSSSHTQHKLFEIMDVHCTILSFLDINSLHRCKHVNKDWNRHASHPSSTKTFDVLDYFIKTFFLSANMDRFDYNDNHNYKPKSHHHIPVTVLKKLYNLLSYVMNVPFNWIKSITLWLLHYMCCENTKSKIAEIIIGNNADYQYKYCPPQTRVTRCWFDCCSYNNRIYWKNYDDESVKKCKHFDISQFSKSRKIILDLSRECSVDYNFDGSKKTHNLKCIQKIIAWYVEQMLCKFNDIEEIIWIQKDWQFAWLPFIILIANHRDKIVEFKYHYGNNSGGGFGLIWWIGFIMTNRLDDDTYRMLGLRQYERLKNMMRCIRILINDNNNGYDRYEQSDYYCNYNYRSRKLRVIAHHCCSDHINVCSPLTIDDSFVESIGGLQQLILINGKVIIDKSFWVAVWNICRNNRQFWNQLELLKIHSNNCNNPNDCNNNINPNVYEYDQQTWKMISGISNNLINLKQFDIMSNSYVLYLLLFHIMANINTSDNENDNYNYNLGKKIRISGCEDVLQLDFAWPDYESRYLMGTIHDWLHKDELNFNCKDLSIDIWLTYFYGYFYSVGFINNFIDAYNQGYKLWKKLLTSNFKHTCTNTDENYPQQNEYLQTNKKYCNLERLHLMWKKRNLQVNKNFCYQPLKLLGERTVIFTRFQMLEISLSCEIDVIKILEMMQIIRNNVKHQQKNINMNKCTSSHLFMRLYLHNALLAPLQMNDYIKAVNHDNQDDNDGGKQSYESYLSKSLDIVGDLYKFGLTDCFVIVPARGHSTIVNQGLAALYKDVVSKHWLSNYCTIYGDGVEREKLHRTLKPVIKQRCEENSYCQVSPGFDSNKTVTITIYFNSTLTLFVQNAV